MVLLLYTALRLSELVTLDVADARLSARKACASFDRLETTRRYSLPSPADRQAAMDNLEIEP